MRLPCHNDEMKQVLIIAHLNPAFGSFRPIPLARYLPEFGWEPIILTPSNYDKPKSPFPFRVIETPYSDVKAVSLIKKLLKLNTADNIGSEIRTRIGITNKNSLFDPFLRLGSEILAYPDFCKRWLPFALKSSEELLRTEKIEAIISSSNPLTSSLVTSKLKARYATPWLADLCDLWSQNHDYHYSPLRKILDKRMELKTLARADALVTVSTPWAEKLRTLHKGKQVHVVTHGFAPEEVNIPPVSLTSKFTITYTGTIYTRNQTPIRLLDALKQLIDSNIIDAADIEVRFYGTNVTWLDEEIRQRGLHHVVKNYNRIPKNLATQRQRESQVLLLLKWEDEKERGWHSGKIFDYLAARRPILATGGNYDVVSELLTETSAGIDATSDADIRSALIKLYQEYKITGALAYTGNEEAINRYSHREMARKFAEIMDNLI